MKFTNHQFGEFEYEEKHVVEFPEGIIGFEECRKFLIVDDEDSQPFRWLVSLQDAGLSLPLLDPTFIVSDYRSSVQADEDALIFVVSCLDEKLEQSTVNLKSPIVISNAKRIGRQIILENELYGMQHPLFPLTVEHAEE